MKAIKRIICIALVMCLLMTVLPISISAYTGNKSSADAIAWAQSKLGVSLDYDGVYGAQCVDLIMYYYVFLGNSVVWGNGKDYATNSLPNGWTRIKNYSGFVPQPGDIAIWTTGGGGNGHVAIVISGNASTMTVVEQNAGGRQYCTMNTDVSTSGIWGVIRPDFPNNTPVDVGTNFYAYIINTAAWKHLTNDVNNVSLRSEKGDLNQMWYFERLSDGSYKITSAYDGNCMEVWNFGTTDGTNVQTLSYNGNTAQQWYISGESAKYVFRAKCTNCVLDVDGGLSEEGTNVQMWTYNGSDAQLFQIWRLNTYEVNYDANGGSGAPNSQTKIELANLALSDTKPTRTGYTFTGWNTKADGTGTAYAAGASYTSNAVATLYAQWEEEIHTFIFEAKTDATEYLVNKPVTITVVTDKSVSDINLVNENGKYIVKTDSSCKENADGTLTWTVSTSFGTKGERSISIFTVDENGESVDSGVTVSFIVDTVISGGDDAVATYMVKAPASAVKNESFVITVETTTSTTKVGIFNESGSALGKVSQSYADKDGVRTWTIGIKIGSRGDRSLTVKATDRSGIWSEGKQVNISVK